MADPIVYAVQVALVMVTLLALLWLAHQWVRHSMNVTSARQRREWSSARSMAVPSGAEQRDQVTS